MRKAAAVCRRLPAPLLALSLIILLLAGCAARGKFASDRTPAGPVGAMSRQPAAVTFLDLDANPHSYRNRLVRVTGAFLPAPDITCRPFKGPDIDWAIVDSELRLDVQGFAQVMALMPEGMPVTVDGFWQLYQGPVGCGKEPPRQSLWYLRAVQLVQPNPLPLLAEAPGEPVETEGEPEETPEPEETGTATPTPTASPSVTPQETLETATPDLTASPTAEGEEAQTATPSPIPDADETPEVTPSATPSATPTPPPPGPTPPPGDYPDPTAAPSATPSPDPYG